MAILHLLQQLLTTKAAAVLAAFALIGGGAAIASEVVAEPADKEPEESTDADLDEVSLEGLQEQQLQLMAETCAEDPDAGYCSGDSAGRDEHETDMELGEPTGEGDGDLEDEEADEEEAEEEDTRSETAVRVHRALTGDDTAPGDPEFGRKVSERARSGQPGDLGRLVSRAAQGQEIDDDELKLEPRAPRTSTEDGEEDEASSDGEPEASGRPAQAGPPAGTPAANRGKGRGGR
jgi:hypothetical protein